jgi:hypothetical protein
LRGRQDLHLQDRIPDQSRDRPLPVNLGFFLPFNQRAGVFFKNLEV